MKGVDGTNQGWVIAEYRDRSWEISFEQNLEDTEDETLIIDIPIGLPKNKVRECDSKARDLLSPQRHYSVFNCPTREAVYAETYNQACDINEAKTGKKISKQSWNITPKIREADKQAQKGKNLEEGHPEVFFKALKKNSVKNSKNSKQGLKDRKKVLKKYGDISALDGFDAENVTEDDIVDAMVLALGDKLDLETVPENPGEDEKGLKMCINKPITE
ncbi:DUF429 domain-containing protein [Nanohaloarchaea archaeon]|nr:DUF429 domain-containing protein [Candidatus Nanohaloarchaea archaeon]